MLLIAFNLKIMKSYQVNSEKHNKGYIPVLYMPLEPTVTAEDNINKFSDKYAGKTIVI